MARIVTITQLSDTITCTPEGSGSVKFTITNTGKRLRVGASLLVEGGTQAGWLKIQGAPERELGKNTTDEMVVDIQVSEGTAPGKYKFRLLVFSVDKPDEDYTSGELVSFEVVAKPATPVPPPAKPFPWWIPAMVVAVLIAGGLAIWLWPSGGEDGLIAYWRCDEGSGDTLSDSVGVNHGTLVNDPAWANGKLGRALRFDGSDYVQIPNTKVLEVGSNGADFSVTFWMNLRQPWTGAWRSIMHKGDADTERTFAMWMHPNDNRVYYRISTDADPNEGGDSASQIATNSWTHIAYVKNGNLLQLYINGNLDAQAPLAGTSMSNNGPLYLGKDPSWPGLNGSLDDIRIYDRALPAEVLRVLAEGKSQK